MSAQRSADRQTNRRTQQPPNKTINPARVECACAINDTVTITTRNLQQCHLCCYNVADLVDVVVVSAVTLLLQ